MQLADNRFRPHPPLPLGPPTAVKTPGTGEKKGSEKKKRNGFDAAS